MATLGYIGERLDLLIRQGATFGPFECSMLNPDETPVDLTGCVLQGHIRKKALDNTVVTSLAITITEPVNGRYVFGLSGEATSLIVAGESIKDPVSKYVWDMELIDANLRVIPVYYGDVSVFREVTRA